MILCDEPYLNEPAWSTSGGSPQSRACEYYVSNKDCKLIFLIILPDSANVRRMVVKTAVSKVPILNHGWTNWMSKMLGNLKNPPEPFADIVRTHFRLKARSISSQLDDWLSKDDGKVTSFDGGVYLGVNPKMDNSGSSNGFSKDVVEMKAILKRLQENLYDF